MFMKAGHSSTALALRSGKTVFCFLLAHIHDDYEFGFEVWNQCVFVPVIKYIVIDVLLKVM